MKKVLVVASLIAAGFLVAACGSSPCDELQKTCDKCTDSNQKQACDQTVTTYKSVPTGDTACQSVIDAKTYDSCK